MRSGLLWITLLSSFGLCAQKSYVFPEKFSRYYDFHPDEAYEQLKKLAPKNLQSNLDQYVVDYIYAEQFRFDANHIYLDWPEYEIYLVKILNAVVPSNVEKKKMDVFIERSSERNAGASGFGNIYFNLGMLGYAEDEAFLAEVFAHEGAHILFDHRTKSMTKKTDVVSTGAIDQTKAADYLRLQQTFEVQADSFAFQALKNNKLSFESVLNDYDDEEMRRQVNVYSLSYSKLAKASNLDQKTFGKKKQKDKKPYNSHPSTIERIEHIKKVKNTCVDCNKRYFIDSAFFHKFKRVALEEHKKMKFEKGDYDDCLRAAFLDHLANPKNLRNIYYIIESIRRTLYIDPKLAQTGFLTQYIDDTDLYYETKSVLYKPDYLFESLKQYETFKDHAFFTKEKPFNTYHQAFHYFVKEALKYNFNEANLSLGLYYYATGKTDSCIQALKKYVESSGLHTEFAQNFITTQKPSIEKGKMLIVYDNIGNYNLDYTFYGPFKYSYHTLNYYLTKKRKRFNPEIRAGLIEDSTKTDLMIVNEYLGSKPLKLYEMQKLGYLISKLYSEDDVEMCKKRRLSASFFNEKKELSSAFKKHILVLAPEMYSWMKNNGYDKIFYVDVVYEYRGSVDENEYYNTYTGYYLDMNDVRPYMKDAVRLGNNRKQKESEICKDLHYFLYE